MKKTLDFPSKIENLVHVENLIDEMSETYDLGSELYGNILVAIIEAVNNAVLHGNKLDPKKTAEEKEQRFLENVSKVQPIEPVVAIAKHYRGRSPMAVASGGVIMAIEKILEAIGLTDHVDASNIEFVIDGVLKVRAI